MSVYLCSFLLLLIQTLTYRSFFIHAQDIYEKLVQEKESNLKKKTLDHFLEQRALSKSVSNLELEVAAEHTQRKDAVYDRQYHVHHAAKEANATILN